MEEQKLDKESYFLRVGVKGGGCSGISYEMGFDDIPQEGDNVIEGNSIKIVIDKKSFLYLFGTELDRITSYNVCYTKLLRIQNKDSVYVSPFA